MDSVYPTKLYSSLNVKKRLLVKQNDQIQSYQTEEVMIAQWEKECISLSVLSVARVMIAQ